MNKNMWVNILRDWYVLSKETKRIGETISVEKRDGSKTEEKIVDIVGMFKEATIYRVEERERKSKPLF